MPVIEVVHSFLASSAAVVTKVEKGQRTVHLSLPNDFPRYLDPIIFTQHKMRY